MREDDKPEAVQVARDLVALGFEVVATAGTAKVIGRWFASASRQQKVTEGRPHVVDMIKNDEVTLIITTTEGRQSIADSYPFVVMFCSIRSTAPPPLRRGSGGDPVRH